MLIHIDTAGGFRVTDADNLRDLRVIAPCGQTAEQLAHAVGTDGRADAEGGAIWLRIDALRVAARGERPDPEWLRAFDTMIAFARKHGWVDDAGAVRAHIDWTEPEGKRDDDQI